ncbi:hypothetical protein PAHAL_1G090900 [Panicum hallii]|jgi:hypothetical protein|uniref:DUF4408 domain-containing protein n=1 Tax=Panicum hallii TaxID=206008 RepID=A0A2T8KUL5_9POAL|nr:uncharacterized protein LOC112872859 [Panicum hallii]PVH65855.1 hypothetical protein PAHAL_1G090900 [Panicum hallii]
MLEAARGWLTPAVLFVAVNLVIATIAVASRLMPAAAPGDERRRLLLRAPSLAVDRLRASLSFSRLGLAADHAPLFDDAGAEPSSPLAPPATTGAGAPGDDGREAEREAARIERSRSEAAAEAAPASSNRRPRARRMRRAATEDPALAEARGAGRGEEPAVEVDARADDFIRQFREQLRLQRLDSILRYRDTLRRTGTA